MAQWTECWPVNQRVASSIPSQGTCLVVGQVPSWGCGRGNHILMFLSLSFSLPSPLSKNKPNKILKKEKKKRVVKLKDLKIALKKMLDEDHINNWFRQMSMSMLKSHWLKVCGVVNKLHDLKVLLNKLLTDYKGMGTWRASLTCPLMWQNKKYLPPLQYSW